MEKHLRSSASMESTHAELEAFVVEEGREYQRRLLQAHLELRAERERPVEVQGADGVPRRHRRLSSRALLSVVGEVEVPRVAYQAPGAPGLHPMDAALNLPDELYSHSVRRVVAENAARSSFDEVVEALLKSTGAAVPKRQVEQLAARAAQDFDAFYSTRAVDVEDTQALLVLSFDGKGIAMRREDLTSLPTGPRKPNNGSRAGCTSCSQGARPELLPARFVAMRRAACSTWRAP
jgi:hypothetical protein